MLSEGEGGQSGFCKRPSGVGAAPKCFRTDHPTAAHARLLRAPDTPGLPRTPFWRPAEVNRASNWSPAISR
eukprot:15460321-Alexandrium_andersonii.AAC.1